MAEKKRSPTADVKSWSEAHAIKEEAFSRFRQEVLLNPEYSEEQKKFLADCFLEGDSVYEIRKFAHPKIPISITQELRKKWKSAP
ncbi:MAG: hypothetical protein LIV24_09225 [Eubacterium sp.]|nr:hypothetical protein [Eubacterium sp.]